MKTKMDMDLKQITAILPQGIGYKILELLHNNDITTANIQHARGQIVGEVASKVGKKSESELELLSCVCKEDEADKIFRYIYQEAKLDYPGAGFIFMEKLTYGTKYKIS